MALINCPDCQSQVSSTARTCPKCNANIQLFIQQLEENIKVEVGKSINRSINKFLIVAFLIGGIIYYFLNN